MFKHKVSAIIGASLMMLLSSCSFYHMQTPETVPVGKVNGGIGMFGVVVDGSPAAFPGLWVRTGVAPKFDMGVHTWGLGIKLDGKYGFNKYIGLGAGAAGSFLGAFVYGLEGSLYTGIPAGIIYPYAVGRMNIMGFSANFENETFEDIGSLFTGVGGIKLSLGTMLRLYLEGGIGLPLSDVSGSAEPVFGIGVQIGQ
jgi:hypothetical protein